MKLTASCVLALCIGLIGNALASTPSPALAGSPAVVIYNDGRNTYIKSVPGLIVAGATADGERLILPGVRHEVQAYLRGELITIAEQQPAPSKTFLNERLMRLEEDLKQKEHALAQVRKPEPPPPTVAHQVWEIRRSDGTIFNALTRWAAAANPKRQIVFATEGIDFPADAEAALPGDFDTAIGDVVKSLQHSKYPVRACFWDNKPFPVVKIIHKTKRCED